MRVALYARVSTDEQSTDMQLADLTAVAARSGWTIVATHIDHGISGGKGREKRPGLDALWKQVTRREIDLVACWKLDRLGRSTRELILFADECRVKGVGMYFHRDAIDTSTPVGHVIFTVIAAVAQYERTQIRERVTAGVRLAIAKGKKWGAKPTDPAIAEQVKAALAEGVLTGRQIAAKFGIGETTVRYIKHGYQRRARQPMLATPGPLPEPTLGPSEVHP